MMNFVKKTLKHVGIVFGVLMLLQIDIYASSDLLSEAEVKSQITSIMDSLKTETSTDFTPTSYDINDLYCLEEITYILNDYQNDISFTDMLHESTTRRDWILPYQNINDETYSIHLVEEAGVVRELYRNSDIYKTNDMKLKNGEFEEIDINQVAEIHYVNLVLYDFNITYVRMKNDSEYIIPYVDAEWIGLECKKLYSLQEFFEYMKKNYDDISPEEVQPVSEAPDWVGAQGIVQEKDITNNNSIYGKVAMISICPILLVVVLLLKKNRKKHNAV